MKDIVISFDLSLLGWRQNVSDLVMFAFSPDATLEVFFPAYPENSSLLHLVVFVRDRFDCVTEVNVSSVTIDPEPNTIETFINRFNDTTNETFTRLLTTLNQNLISQVIVSVSQVLPQQSMRKSSRLYL